MIVAIVPSLLTNSFSSTSKMLFEFKPLFEKSGLSDFQKVLLTCTYYQILTYLSDIKRLLIFKWTDDMIENLANSLRDFKINMDFRGLDFDGDKPFLIQ